jgi:tetratricopeptide (TPR) repeat protein
MKVIIRSLTVLMMCSVAASLALAEGKISITTSSDEARQLYLQGRDLTERFKNPEARALFEQAVAKDPNFALAYRDLAQSEPSIKAYQADMAKAVALSSKVSECERYWILADEAGGQQNLVVQRKNLSLLLAGCPQDERAHSAMGIYYYARQAFDSAAMQLQQAVELGPTFIPAWNMLGYARRALGDFAGSEQAFRKYIELSPTDANAYDSYAELLLKEGKYDDAVLQYRKAMSVDTTFVISHFNIAAPLVYLGRHEDARHELQELINRAADDGQRQTAYFGMAAVYADQGKFDDAVGSIQKSEQIAAKISDTAQMVQNAAIIGFLRLQQGRYDDAVTQYERSASLARMSNLAPTQKALAERNLNFAKARVALAKHDFPTAKKQAAMFATLATESANPGAMRTTHLLNGMIALEEKSYNKAIEELKMADMQSGFDRYYLAMAYEGAGRHSEAVEQMTAAANINTVLNLGDVMMHGKAKQSMDEWAKR